jgi:hypothetical protein
LRVLKTAALFHLTMETDPITETLLGLDNWAVDTAFQARLYTLQFAVIHCMHDVKYMNKTHIGKNVSVRLSVLLNSKTAL